MAGRTLSTRSTSPPPAEPSSVDAAPPASIPQAAVVDHESASGRPTGKPPEPVHSYALFQEPWWLDTVAPGRWAEVAITRGGKTVARLPYVLRGPSRMRIIAQPVFTPFLGPWFAPAPGARESKVLHEEMELLAELESKLPQAAGFRQTFSPRVMGVLPLIWAGYRADMRYTYRFEDMSSADALWNGLSQNIRRNVRKARKAGIQVRDDLDVESFHAVLSMTFDRHGFPPPNRALIKRIDEACTARGSRLLLSAHDQHGKVHAAVYLVRDRHTSYYLFGASDPLHRNSGAQTMLLWEAISRSRDVSSVFDFEGSMLPHVEKYFRLFGARQTPFLQLNRASPVAATALSAQAAWARLVPPSWRIR